MGSGRGLLSDRPLGCPCFRAVPLGGLRPSVALRISVLSSNRGRRESIASGVGVKAFLFAVLHLRGVGCYPPGARSRQEPRKGGLIRSFYLVSSHGEVLFYVAANPHCTVDDIEDPL